MIFSKWVKEKLLNEKIYKKNIIMEVYMVY